jgi:mannitol/fructose-specific phosphotransferase system IIA component
MQMVFSCDVRRTVFSQGVARKEELVATMADVRHEMSTAVASSVAVPHAYYPGTNEVADSAKHPGSERYFV